MEAQSFWMLTRLTAADPRLGACYLTRAPSEIGADSILNQF